MVSKWLRKVSTSFDKRPVGPCRRPIKIAENFDRCNVFELGEMLSSVCDGREPYSSETDHHRDDGRVEVHPFRQTGVQRILLFSMTAGIKKDSQFGRQGIFMDYPAGGHVVSSIAAIEMLSIGVVIGYELEQFRLVTFELIAGFEFVDQKSQTICGAGKVFIKLSLPQLRQPDSISVVLELNRPFYFFNDGRSSPIILFRQFFSDPKSRYVELGIVATHKSDQIEAMGRRIQVRFYSGHAPSQSGLDCAHVG